MDNIDFIEKAEKKIKEGLSVDDLIRKLLAFSDSLEKGENIIFEQLNDLYFFYYPEAAYELKERDKFVSTLKEFCERKEISEKLNIASDSMGYDLLDKDLQIISMSVNELSNISALRAVVNERLYEIVKKEYPNLTAVLGPEMAAKILYIAKGSRSLMFMPASKIQVLGAEKAMFASRKKKMTPKYGVIFNSDLIFSAPDKLKGKLAKVLASYSSLAIKTDVLSKEDKSKEILEKMEKDIKRVKK